MERLAYRPAEVAKMIGVDKQTLNNWLNKGIITGAKIEGCWIVSTQEIYRIIGVKDNKPVLTNSREEYRKWFESLSDKEKLQEIGKLLHY